MEGNINKVKGGSGFIYPVTVAEAVFVNPTTTLAERLLTLGGGGSGHTHSNQTTLDKFGESLGVPTFNGAAIGGGAGGSIFDNSITARQTQFFNEEILNVYNKETATIDRLLSAAGVANVYSGTFVTDFIEVVEGRTYKTNLTWSSCYYNANKVFMSVVAFNGGLFTVPSGVRYIRLSSSTNSNLVNVGFVSEDIHAVSAEPFNSRRFTIRNEATRAALSNALKPSLRGKRYAYIGDSITTPAFSYGAIASAQLNLVKNMQGYSGGRYSIPSGSVGTMYERVMAVPVDGADIVTFMAGTNDIGNTSTMGVFSDRELTTFYGGLHKTFLAAIERFPNAKIGVMSPLQRNGVEVLEYRNKMLSYVNAIKEVAEYYNLPYFNLWAESGLAISRGSVFSTTYTTDGLHLNEAGHQLISNPIIKFIESMCY